MFRILFYFRSLGPLFGPLLPIRQSNWQNTHLKCWCFLLAAGQTRGRAITGAMFRSMCFRPNKYYGSYRHYSPDEPCQYCGCRWPGARLTKAYDVTIQRYRNSHAKIHDSKMHILRCMGSKFCVKFQRCPLKFHTKFWTHTPQNMHFMRW